MRSHPKKGKVVRLEVDSWSDSSYVLNVKALVGDFETSNFAKVRFQHSLLTTEHLPRWQLSDYSVASWRLAAAVWRSGATRKKLKSKTVASSVQFQPLSPLPTTLATIVAHTLAKDFIASVSVRGRNSDSSISTLHTGTRETKPNTTYKNQMMT